ncbi:ArsR family transcriptional regulator [Candidatus Thorarchaeota archaeon]|nr:MAG: ArsR family transcriptional regulator [Candidatus Thorarchaeota archaeon]
MTDSLNLSSEERVFQSQPRFSIMYLLFLKRKIGFIELKELLDLTPGNLDHHIKKLEETGFVHSRRVLSWKPLVVITITPSGTNTFRDYILKLKTLLSDIPENLLHDTSDAHNGNE